MQTRKLTLFYRRYISLPQNPNYFRLNIFFIIKVYKDENW